jgi:hypothetical protein
MKKIEKRLKLTLNRETLLKLNSDTLGQALGGARLPSDEGECGPDTRYVTCGGAC